LILGGLPPQGSAGVAQDGNQPTKSKTDPTKATASAAKSSTPKLGLAINDPRALQGYTLLATMMSKKTYLIDMQGKVVRTWDSTCNPAASAYLLENGHLLRTGSLMGEEMSFGGGPGAGGRVQEFSWNGELVWDFKLFTDKQLPHHDVTRLPNGNMLMIVWDKKTAKEAIAAGRRPEMTGDSHLLPDSLIEVKPTGPTTGAVVWEWHLWDHLVQDFDKSKANYGNVAEHPELVNINYGEDALAPVAATKAGADKLKSIGYVGANTASGRPPRINPDWTHFNCVAYNPDLDQIVVSVHSFSEFWIVDHSTTTAEAASHSGGRSGKGGDLLYRWGNPRAYRAGTKADQRLFAQHNAHWIPRGLPGEGHLLVFNNGSGRPDGSYSSVDELVLPVDSDGQYLHKPGTAYGPDKPIWSYTAPKKTDFYSFFISGAQRLPNGSTLICSGANGTIFEVTPEKEVVWKYVNPVKTTGPGPGMFGGAPQPGQFMPAFLQGMLRLSPEQNKQIGQLQKEVDGQLDKLLTAEQKKQFKERPAGANPGGFGGAMPQPGQIISAADQTRLKLTGEQKKQLAEFQKTLDGKLDKILKEEQKKQLKDMRSGVAFGGFTPGGPGGPGGNARPGEILSAGFQDQLKLTAEQKKQLQEFQKQTDDKLAQLLSDDQQKQFKQPQGFGSAPQPGQLMAPTLQARLKLTADQKKVVAELQKEIDGKLDKLFTDDQKKQFKELRQNFGRGGPGGMVRMGPGGPGGFPGGGPGAGSALFRAYRYPPSYPGLAGKDLTPGKTVEELQPKETKQATAR
jgi:Spy/CpxP family protein refolding chaperone